MKVYSSKQLMASCGSIKTKIEIKNNRDRNKIEFFIHRPSAPWTRDRFISYNHEYPN